MQKGDQYVELCLSALNHNISAMKTKGMSGILNKILIMIHYWEIIKYFGYFKATITCIVNASLKI
jgi:hypothetical protein